MNYLEQWRKVQFVKDLLEKDTYGITMKMPEALFLGKLFQTESQAKNNNKNVFDLYSTLSVNLSNEGERRGFIKIFSCSLY